ncbi:MAG: TIM barrel protein [Vicinamibacterales bacterium]
MKIGVYTKALEELTPRAVRDADPDRAIEDWAVFAQRLGATSIQLAAAQHPSERDVPPEAQLDPVANTLDLREPFTPSRAQRVQEALRSTGIQIADLGYFDNLLHDDVAIRAQKHRQLRKVFDAAALLGVDAVCGFVGRNLGASLAQNLGLFEDQMIPLLRDARDRGLTYRVEQCPMPGWTTGDSYYNNLAYTPAIWIALHRICERHGLGATFRIHYDPSHAILIGQDTRGVFEYLKQEGYGFLIGGFHVKGQVIDPRGVAAWGYGGQTVGRGDWVNGVATTVASEQRRAWQKQTAIAEHELPGTARHDPLAYLQHRSVDWLDHQLAARELLDLDVANTHLIVEHEFPGAKTQDQARLFPILQGSIAFVRRIDEAAACMYELQREVEGRLKA